MDKYGAFVEKKMYGKVVQGTNRITYVVDPEGKIAAAYPEVDPASHALQLLTDLKKLKKAFKKISLLSKNTWINPGVFVF